MAKTLFHDDRAWTNWHLTVKDVPIAGRFELMNSTGAPTLARMAESAAAVQALIGRAFVERRRLRAQGAAWSFSEAASVPGGWSLATGYANWLFPLPASHVHAGFAGDKTDSCSARRASPFPSSTSIWRRKGGRCVPRGPPTGRPSLAR